MTTTCRLAIAADTPTIHALLTQMATELGRAIDASPATLALHGFGAKPLFRVILAERDETPVGLALIYPEYSSWRGKVGVYVQDLYVTPDARGSGIAQTLLAKAFEAGADWMPDYLTLMVSQTNPAAQRWYDKLGFTLRERGDLLMLGGAPLAALRERNRS